MRMGGHARAERVCARARARCKDLVFVGALPQKTNEWNKCKNHFYEMKGDVVMSLHEKERNKKMPIYTKKVTHNPIPTFFFFQDHNVTYFAGNWISRCFAVCFA